MGANATKEDSCQNETEDGQNGTSQSNNRSFKLKSKKNKNKENSEPKKSEDNPQADDKGTLSTISIGEPPADLTEEQILLIKESFSALEKDVAKVGVVMFIR